VRHCLDGQLPGRGYVVIGILDKSRRGRARATAAGAKTIRRGGGSSRAPGRGTLPARLRRLRARQRAGRAGRSTARHGIPAPPGASRRCDRSEPRSTPACTPTGTVRRSRRVLRIREPGRTDRGTGRPVRRDCRGYVFRRAPASWRRRVAPRGVPFWREWSACCLFKAITGSTGQLRGVLAVPPLAAQRRQADAGGIKTAIDGKNLARDVAGAIAAQKENRLRQFLLEAVTIERNRVVIVGADFRGVDRLGHRGFDRPGCYAIDANAERGELDGELLGQMRKPGLAGAIGR